MHLLSVQRRDGKPLIRHKIPDDQAEAIGNLFIKGVNQGVLFLSFFDADFSLHHYAIDTVKYVRIDRDGTDINIAGRTLGATRVV